MSAGATQQLQQRMVACLPAKTANVVKSTVQIAASKRTDGRLANLRSLSIRSHSLSFSFTRALLAHAGARNTLHAQTPFFAELKANKRTTAILYARLATLPAKQLDAANNMIGESGSICLL